MAKTRRRKVDPSERLSTQMLEVLRWAYDNHMGDPQKFVPWSPSAFIGENPSQSKSNALSTSLKRLEERGLLIRYSITYKDNIITRLVWPQVAEGRIRTSHVQLTSDGFSFVESLIHDDIDPEKEEADRQRYLLKRRAEGLRIALGLINERIEQGMDSDAERDARRARLAVAESLNQAMAEYRSAA